MKRLVCIFTLFLLVGFSAFSQSKDDYNFIISDNLRVNLKFKKAAKINGLATKYTIYATVVSGYVPENVIYEWNIKYADRNKSETGHNVKLILKRGNQNFNQKKIDSFINYTDYLDVPSNPTERKINVPKIITVDGTLSIMEGERANLSVSYTGNATDYTWKWYEIRGVHNDAILVQGENVTLPSFAPGTRRCYVVGVHKDYGFTTEINKFNIEVRPIFVPSSEDFFVTASANTIYKRESVTLSVNYNGNTPNNLIWRWYANGIPTEKTGWRITDYPSKTTLYAVKAEVHQQNKTKQSSLSSTKKVDVLPIPEAPAPIAIKADKADRVIKEGESVTLTVNADSKSPYAGKETYRWTNKKTGQVLSETGNTIKVSPRESTNFEVSTVLIYGGHTDISDPKTINIEVIRKTTLPTLKTNTTFCLTGKENYKSLPLQFENGVLGNGSKKWILFRGEYGGASEKIDSTSGNQLNVPFPKKTTNYYIMPDKDPGKYRKFTINIMSKPDVSGWSISADKSSVCNGETVTVKLIGDNIPSGTEFKWEGMYETNKRWSPYDRVEKEITITPSSSGTIRLTINNKSCEIYNKAFEAKVSVLDFSLSNIKSTTKISKPEYSDGLKRKVKFRYVSNTPNIQLFWTTNPGEKKITNRQLLVTDKKIEKVYLMATSSCGTIQVDETPVKWNKTLREYAFFNLGTINSQPNSFFSKNIMMTAGTKSFYFRTKLSLNSAIFVLPTYTSDNSHILDYPINTNTYYEFTGDVDNRRNSVMVGLFLKGNVIKPYFGAGYGAKNTIWRANIFEYYSNKKLRTRQVRNITQQSRGLELETGLFFDLGKSSKNSNHSIHGVNIITGVNCILDFKNNKQYFDTQIGLGINLDNFFKN